MAEMSELLRRSVRHVAVRGEMNLPSGGQIILGPEDILSLSISEGVGDGMLLGACPSASLRLVLADPQGDFLYLGSRRGASSTVGAKVRLFLRAMDDDGGGQEMPLGHFYVTDMAGRENDISCTVQGVDALGYLFEGAFADTLTYPATLRDMVQLIARCAGVTVNTDFPGADGVMQTPPDMQGYTLRRALSCAVAACGCFAHVDRQGDLRIAPVRDSQTPYEIPAQNALQRQYGDMAFGPLNALRVHLTSVPRGAEDGTKLYTDQVGVAESTLLTIGGNPIFAYGAAHTDALASAALANLRGLNMERALLRWQGDPQLLLGRCLSLRDKRGQVTLCYATRQTLTFDKGFSMQTDCTVRTPYAAGAGVVLSPTGQVQGASLTGSVDGRLILDGSLGVTALTAHSITGHYIAAGAIDAQHLSAGSVTAGKIGAGEIRAVHIAGKTITAEQLAAGLITADSGLIANSAIGTAQIADGSITSAKVVSLNADVIDAGTLKAQRLLLVGEGGVIYEINAQASGLSLNELQKEQYKTHLNGTVIVAKSITAAQIAARSITANEILSGTITAGEIAAETITASQIAAHSITVNRLAADVGSSLDLSSNASINLMVGKLPATYVQWGEPTAAKKGDTWVNTGGETWQTVAAKTWQSVGASAWGALYNAHPRTYVYDGSKWQLTADQETMATFKMSNEEMDLRVKSLEGATPDELVNNAVTINKQGVDVTGGQVNIRAGSEMHIQAGSAFTVDAPNFNLDENGNANMQNASVNGQLMNNGEAVLTARNLVVSSTQPVNPIPGMVWVKPVGAVAATFLYNNTAIQSFEKMESVHTLTNLGSATTASGTYTWNVSIPYKVLADVTAARYLKMKVGDTVLFADVALATVTGTYTLELSGMLTEWLGNADALDFTLELYFLSGSDESYLHNVHRLNTGAVELQLTAKTDAASGWLSTEVQVYNV